MIIAQAIITTVAYGFHKTVMFEDGSALLYQIYPKFAFSHIENSPSSIELGLPKHGNMFYYPDWLRFCPASGGVIRPTRPVHRLRPCTVFFVTPPRRLFRNIIYFQKKADEVGCWKFWRNVKYTLFLLFLCQESATWTCTEFKIYELWQMVKRLVIVFRDPE